MLINPFSYSPKEHIYHARIPEDAEKGALVAEVEALHVVAARDWRNLEYSIIKGKGIKD